MTSSLSFGNGSCLKGIRGSPSGRQSSTKKLVSGSPGTSVIPLPRTPPFASWAKVVIVYLLSDFFGLWHAMQFCSKIGATSLRNPTGGGSSAWVEGTIARVSKNVARLSRAWFISESTPEVHEGE